MLLNYVYDAESEKRRVEYTLSRLEFYENKNLKVNLPTGNLANLEELLANCNLELDNLDPKIVIVPISTFYLANKPKIIDYLKALPFAIPDSLDLIITKYGVGGSYYPPNRIILNVHYLDDIVRVFMHELTHLAVEVSVVQALRLPHAEKENLVNWLLTRSELVKDGALDVDIDVREPTAEILGLLNKTS